MPVDYLRSFSHPQHDYVAAGLDCKLVDPDGGVHVRRLQAQISQVVPHTLPSDGWTSSLQQLPPFSYSCLYAHLVTNSETVAENQRSAATQSYRAVVMKRKEQGYCLFRDDHVNVVRFHPGSASDNQCLFHAEVKPSMKMTGSYSTVHGCSEQVHWQMAHVVSVKQDRGDAANMLLHCYTISSTMLNLDYLPFLKTRCVPTNLNSGTHQKCLLLA